MHSWYMERCDIGCKGYTDASFQTDMNNSVSQFLFCLSRDIIIGHNKDGS